MSLTAGAGILASTWNAHVRAFTKPSVFYKKNEDKAFAGDASISGEVEFWTRSSGWNWPDFYDDTRTYTFVEGDEYAFYEGDYIVAMRAGVGVTLPPGIGVASWTLYRYEFGYQSVVTGDEVVYGNGLFEAIANAGVTPPVQPTYTQGLNGVLEQASDSNYNNLMTNNTTLRLKGNDQRVIITLYLLRPGFTETLITQNVILNAMDVTNNIWLSPGKYRLEWEFQDTVGAGTSYIYVNVQKYDDNVKQYEELRAFTSDLSELAAKGTTKLTASAMNTAPLCTGADIDDKGGTASLYTGDW